MAATLRNQIRRALRNDHRHFVEEHAKSEKFAVIWIVNELGEYLAVKVWDKKANAYLYTAPGGCIDKNEETFHAACRELREETGIIADTNKRGSKWLIAPSNKVPPIDASEMKFTYIFDNGIGVRYYVWFINNNIPHGQVPKVKPGKHAEVVEIRTLSYEKSYNNSTTRPCFNAVLSALMQ